MKSDACSGTVSRREFLGVGLAAGAGLFCRPARGGSSEVELDAVAKAVGWDAQAPGSFYFLHVTDLHASELTSGALKMPDKFGGRNFADDMNLLRPAPAFTAVTGDLIARTTRSPATWPQAEVGFRRVEEKIVSRLTMPCHMIIGNNDCSPEAFHKVWPDRPVYWSFDQQGVHFAGLHGYNCWTPENGNHAGILLDDEQLAWLAKDIAAVKTPTLVLFTHEPLCDPDCHRIRKQLAPILAKYAGEMWNIAGHNHANVTRTVKIGTKPVHVLETITPVGSWTPDKGAYRLIFVSDGRVAGSALRWLTKDGDPLRFDVDDNYRTDTVSVTCEENLRENAVRTFMVGEEDVAIRQDVTQVTDRVSNFRFTDGRGLVYRIPLEDWGKRVRRLGVAGQAATLAIAFSTDGQNWQQSGKIESQAGIACCDIPSDLVAGECLYLRLAAVEGQSQQVYGIALLP